MYNQIRAILSSIFVMFKQMLEEDRRTAEENRKVLAEHRQHEKLQKEANERQQAEHQKQIWYAQMVQMHDANLRKLWAHALNALPPHLRLATIYIDAVALINKYCGGARWTLKVSVPNGTEYTRIRVHQLQEMLNQIFLQIYTDGIKEFTEYIMEDRNCFQSELGNFNMGLNANYPNEHDYLVKYQNFYKVNCWKLYSIRILDIIAEEYFLNFMYDVSFNTVLYFQPSNYRILVNSI